MIRYNPTRQASRRLLLGMGMGVGAVGLWGVAALAAQPAPSGHESAFPIVLAQPETQAGAQAAAQVEAKPAPPAAAQPSTGVPAGSTLPAASPTGQTAATPATPPADPQPEPVRRVDVSYAEGDLVVDADNGSLNQILREISSKTGMKITGGVAEEPVYGHYGPASPSSVLASLLDGTGSNMLLLDDHKGASELILTPRAGGATLPDPNAVAQDAQAAQQEPPQPAGAVPLPRGNPRFARPTAEMMQRVQNSEAGATNATNATSDTQSPNGIRTPQQIYDDLRQSQAAQAAAPTPASDTPAAEPQPH
jgi:hypothetical protein